MDGAPAGAGGSGLGGTVYQPHAQGTADTGFQNIVQGLYGQAAGGESPGQFYYPQVQSAVGGVVNNPYAAGALAPADYISDAGRGFGENLVDRSRGLLVPAAAGGLPYAGQALDSGFSGEYGQVVNAAEHNPFLDQGYTGAVAGANLGNTAALQGAQLGGQVNALGAQFPGIGARYGDLIAGSGNSLPYFNEALTGAAGALPGYAMGATGGTGTTAAAQAGAYGLAPAAAGLSGGATAPAGYLQGLGRDLSGGIAGAAGPLGGVASSILNTGFDPQQALYDRTRQRTLDSSNAVNSMSGIASTPYGAGVTNQNLTNFDIDWQNQQLARQAQAASTASGVQQGIGGLFGQAGSTAAGLDSTAGSLYGTGSNILGTAGGLYGQSGSLGSQLANQYATGAGIREGAGGLSSAAGGLANTQAGIGSQALNANVLGANTAANLDTTGFNLGSGASGLAASSAALPGAAYGNNLAAIVQALNAKNNAGLVGANTFSNLIGGAGGGLAQGGAIGNAGLGMVESASAYPYNIANTMAGNQLSGLGQGINLGNQQYALPQQIISDLQSYLGLGQSASTISGQLGQMGLNQLGQAAQGFGGLASGANSLFGSSGLFGSGGGAGAGAAGFGLNEAGYPLEFGSQAAAEAAGGGGGIGSILSSLLPAAASA